MENEIEPEVESPKMSKSYENYKSWGTPWGDFGRHFGPHWVPKGVPKSQIFAENQHKIRKNEIQECVWKKHEMLMKIRCQNERLWEAKTCVSLDTCRKIGGFGGS